MFQYPAGNGCAKLPPSLFGYIRRDLSQALLLARCHGCEACAVDGAHYGQAQRAVLLCGRVNAGRATTAIPR